MDNQNNKNKGPNNNRQGWGIILFTTLLITFIVMGLFSLMRGGTPEEISYDKFLKLVDNKKVESVTFTNSRINIVLTDSARKEKLKGTLKEVKDESKKSSSSKESTEKSSTSDSSKDSSSSAGENGTYDLISQLQEQMQDSGDTEEKDPDYYTGLVNDETLVEKLKKGGVQFKAEVPDTAGCFPLPAPENDVFVPGITRSLSQFAGNVAAAVYRAKWASSVPQTRDARSV